MEALRAVVVNADTQPTTSEKVFKRLAAIGDDTENLKGVLPQMTRPEVRMKTIIETGSTLVRRLQPKSDIATVVWIARGGSEHLFD